MAQRSHRLRLADHVVPHAHRPPRLTATPLCSQRHAASTTRPDVRRAAARALAVASSTRYRSGAAAARSRKCRRTRSWKSSASQPRSGRGAAIAAAGSPHVPPARRATIVRSGKRPSTAQSSSRRISCGPQDRARPPDRRSRSRCSGRSRTSSPRSSVGRISSSTWCALSAAYNRASARGLTCPPCMHQLGGSPHPSSRATRLSGDHHLDARPRAAPPRATAAGWLLPAPSPPFDGHEQPSGGCRRGGVAHGPEPRPGHRPR
jgi:hypothetical protein